jgi:signal transduction histidine kinase/DNA-binding response OmpR family regulator
MSGLLPRKAAGKQHAVGVLSPARATPHGNLASATVDDDDDDGLPLDGGPGILVVDDRRSNLLAFEAALAPLGWGLVAVASGQEALARLLAQDFALIVLDIQMADMDGFETARLIRARKRNRDTAIIFVTGELPDDEAVLRGFELGAVDFLTKPIHPAVLRAKARVFLQLHLRTRKLREAQAHLRDRELPRLYEAERLARGAAEAARTRAEFLGRASAMFASSLEYEETLRSVAAAAVPAVADWCAVDLVDGGSLKSVAVAHADPTKAELARRLRQCCPPVHDARTGAMKVIRTGAPELHAEIPETLLAANLRDSEHLRIAHAMGLRSAMLVPIKNQGATIGAITFVLSGSDRRYTEEDLQTAVQLGERAGVAIANARLYDESTRAVRLNELFSGVVGHDLRNPLASIIATAQLLIGRGAGGPDGQALRRILSSGQRMARMIDQLLDFTRVRAGGGIPADPQPMDFATVAHEVIDELRDAYPGHEIVVDKRGALTGTWDADRLAQLLSNLVSNAVQHGRRDAPVRIDADGTTGDAITLAISNAGAIPPDLVPVVFEPFRGGQHRRDRMSGLGLGLYIAQQIALVHGGTIELMTADPQRTTFTVTLPRLNQRIRSDDR